MDRRRLLTRPMSVDPAPGTEGETNSNHSIVFDAQKPETLEVEGPTRHDDCMVADGLAVGRARQPQDSVVRCATWWRGTLGYACAAGCGARRQRGNG